MKNRTTLSFFMFFLANLVLAQNIVVEDSLVQDPQVRISHILEHLDDSQLSPPVLWDRGMDMIDLSQFDGIDDATKFTDTRIFGLAYGAVFSIPTNAANELANPLTAYSTEMHALNPRCAASVLLRNKQSRIDLKMLNGHLQCPNRM